ncbi:MAG TPA: ABC transporter permease [Spirochaetia bacterium]|nr:ABC transporter permease [Spirochaetia bacterium]
MLRRAFAFLQGLALLVVGWELLSLFVHDGVVPGPLPVALVFGRLLATVLWKHAAATLARTLVALVIAFVLAVPAGVALARVRVLDMIFTPLNYLLYPVPKIALLPMILLLFGIGDFARVVLLVIVLYFQMLVSVRDGARSIPEEYIVSISSLGAGRLGVLRYVIWPSLLPNLMTALRLGSATALAVLFFSETFFTKWGLGYFIMDAWMKVSYSEMYAGIVAMGGVGFLVFLGFELIEKRFCRWQQVAKAAEEHASVFTARGR